MLVTCWSENEDASTFYMRKSYFCHRCPICFLVLCVKEARMGTARWLRSLQWAGDWGSSCSNESSNEDHLSLFHLTHAYTKYPWSGSFLKHFWDDVQYRDIVECVCASKHTCVLRYTRAHNLEIVNKRHVLCLPFEQCYFENNCSNLYARAGVLGSSGLKYSQNLQNLH